MFHQRKQILCQFSRTCPTTILCTSQWLRFRFTYRWVQEDFLVLLSLCKCGYKDNDFLLLILVDPNTPMSYLLLTMHCYSTGTIPGENFSPFLKSCLLFCLFYQIQRLNLLRCTKFEWSISSVYSSAVLAKKRKNKKFLSVET